MISEKIDLTRNRDFGDPGREEVITELLEIANYMDTRGIMFLEPDHYKKTDKYLGTRGHQTQALEIFGIRSRVTITEHEECLRCGGGIKEPWRKSLLSGYCNSCVSEVKNYGPQGKIPWRVWPGILDDRRNLF